MSSYSVADSYAHIKKCRQTYLGPAENSNANMFLYSSKDDRLSYENVRLNFAFLKIYDEIIVNAIDNQVRSSNLGATSLVERSNQSRAYKSSERYRIDVSFVRVEDEIGISVRNNGASIPIEKYKAKPRQEDETDVQYQRRMEEESKHMKKYIPEVLFTVPRSSSNYDDETAKTRTTGGLNGLGAKLTSIFSSYFEIDIVNAGKHYNQVIRNNCEDIEEPVIETLMTKENASAADKHSSDYVEITFVPDWPLVDPTLEFKTITPTLKQLVAKRLFDYSHLDVQLYLNSRQLPNLEFIEFARRHLCINEEFQLYEVSCSGRFKDWKIAFGFTTKKALTVSYVNNVVTYEHGQHVTLVMKQITSYIQKLLKKKLTSKSITPRIAIMVYAIIPGVKFASQAKTAISNAKIETPTISNSLLERFVIEQGLVEYFEHGKLKSSNTKATRQRITDIEKLRDAEEARLTIDKRSIKGMPCTLFICEGDSAQTLCDRGIKKLGEQYYGSYALRGKPLNTMKAKKERYLSNKELTELKNAIGLVEGKEYTDLKSLRYQRIVCCKDADYDGSSIMGLVILFFYQYFKSLIVRDDFFYEMITGVVLVYKKEYNPRTSKFVKIYYNLNLFKKDVEAGVYDNSYYFKYVKGLGGNTDLDIDYYFDHLDDHLVHIDCSKELTLPSLQLAYSNENGFTDKRKEWIAAVNDESYLPRDTGTIDFSDFNDIDLALAARDACGRSLPSIADGLKTSNRKVIYTFRHMSEKQAYTSTKVFQITGRVADFAAYHHGDASLNAAITKMAQDFIGSNNLPLLEKDGQFGSRNKLGEDASAPRYIAAYLSPLVKLIFPKIDDELLPRTLEDGELVEPQYYVPIIPLILINGCIGIGTGWSSSIPMFNPRDMIEAVKSNIESYPHFHSLRYKPWCKGFKGDVIDYEDQWVYRGVVNQIDEYRVSVTEIPIYMSIDELRKRMNQLLKDNIISDYINLKGRMIPGKKPKKSKEDEDIDSFEFVLTFNEPVKAVVVRDDLLKLSTSVSKKNLVAFDLEGHPVRYANATRMFVAWFKIRRALYEERHAYIIELKKNEILMLENKLRFSIHVDSYNLKSLSKQQLEELFIREKYPRFDGNKPSDTGSFKYLKEMKVDCSAKYKIDKLKALIAQKKKELELYSKRSIEEIWLEELDALEEALDKRDGRV